MARYFEALSMVKLAENSIMPQVDSHYYREALRSAKDLVPLGEEAEHENLYLFYYVKALAHFYVNEFDSAKETIEKARDLVPDDYRILVLAGRILIKRGEFQNAIIHLDEARKLKSVKAYEAYFYLGEAHEGIGDTDKAWYYYDQCINSWPTKEMKQEALRRKTDLASKPGR
jgi:tetratricopeptide (TPR) repeat protein